MSAPDLLERVRMCLAEVGENPALVTVDPADCTVLRVSPALNRKMAWRAASLARRVDGAKQMCWACDSALHPAMPVPSTTLVAAREACLATRPCVEDCGLDRGES